jgi:hypothetical protein
MLLRPLRTLGAGLVLFSTLALAPACSQGDDGAGAPADAADVGGIVGGGAGPGDAHSGGVGKDAGGAELGGDAGLLDGAPGGGQPDGASEAGPTDALVEPDVPTGPTGYPSTDLLIKIIEPGGGRGAASIGSRTTVGGLLFGDAETITWEANNQQSGAIAEAAFWRSGPIDLEPGDNVVTVTATRGDKVVSDSITITYNPAFKFDGELAGRPNVSWVGATTKVVFTVPLGLYANFQPNTVTLQEVNADGTPKASVGQMVDVGQTGSTGDEIDGDGVFTRKADVTCSGEGPRWYRVSVTVNQGASTYQALSPQIPVWCLQRYKQAECNTDHAVVKDAENKLAGGWAQTDVIADLLTNPAVAAAGRASEGGYGIWVQFESGVLGAVLNTPMGKRGDGAPQGSAPAGPVPPAVGGSNKEIGSRSAIVLAPFGSEFGASDDAPAVAAALSASECPSFTVEGSMALQGPGASLDRFRSLTDYGIVSVSTHGEALFEGLDATDARLSYYWDHVGSQEVIWAGEPVACASLTTTDKACTVSGSSPNGGCSPGTVCVVTSGTGGSTSSGVCMDRTQADLKLGRVIITNKGYAMTPAFFEEYSVGGYPDNLVNLGACRSLYNGSLAATFFAHGSQAITGFSGYVQSEWARGKVTELFEGAVGQGLVGQSHSGGQDPDNPGTYWRLLGAGNLDLSASEIINASFEDGDTTGWRRDGDGRVISQLGGSTAVHGKFMGLISTGLGFTVQTGSLEQDFCIPADKTEVQVYWKFFSEEFLEYCGSQFQDTFQTVLIGAAGQLTLVDLKVDDLCGYGDGNCGSCPNPIACDVNCMGGSGCKIDPQTGICGGSYPCDCGKYFVGLTPSDVQFDQGGVFNVLWQKTTKNIQPLAGAGKVTLRMFASDTGDSIFDTVILMDAIEFK